jgi:hypothetical protein
MVFIIKSILLITLVNIFYLDFKERKAWNFTFPIIAICGGYLFFDNSNWDFFITSVLINSGIVIILILINYLVARFLMKKKFLNEAIGIGDILFFFAFAFSFPPISFINFFVFSVLFTFVFHIIMRIRSSSSYQSAPLAGCMALFLIIIYLIHWMGLYNPVYLL